MTTPNRTVLTNSNGLYVDEIGQLLVVLSSSLLPLVQSDAAHTNILNNEQTGLQLQLISCCGATASSPRRGVSPDGFDRSDYINTNFPAQLNRDIWRTELGIQK